MEKLVTHHQSNNLFTIHPHLVPGLSRIALTGRPASGKSTIIQWLKSLGFNTLELDQITDQIYNDNDFQQNIWAALETKFDPLIDIKSVVRQLLISAPQKFDRIEKVLHHEIYQRLNRIFSALNTSHQNCIIVEIPLIFESNWTSIFTQVIAVERDEDLRQVSLKRRGWSQSYINFVEKRFLPELHVRNQVDYLISNAGSKKQLWLQVKQLIQNA